jgi:HSP20 family protein
MPRREVEEWFWLGAELNRLADEMSRSRPVVASSRAWEPRIDLIEEEHRFLIKAEIAGVRGEDIQLLFVPEHHAVLIRGRREEEDLTDGSRTAIHQLEILYGEFQREVRLPDVSVDASNIRATYRNGFLLVMVPKQDNATVIRTVSVRKI